MIKGIPDAAMMLAPNTTLRRAERSASTPLTGTARRKPTVRAPSTIPNCVAAIAFPRRAMPSTNGRAQVASPDAALPTQSLRNAAVLIPSAMRSSIGVFAWVRSQAESATGTGGAHSRVTGDFRDRP